MPFCRIIHHPHTHPRYRIRPSVLPYLPEHACPHLYITPVGRVLAPWQYRPRPVRVRRRPIGRLHLLRLLVMVPVRNMKKRIVSTVHEARGDRVAEREI